MTDSIPYRFGYIHFEDKDEPSFGYFSIAGGKSTRFEVLGDLPSDVLFWCNLRHDDLYRNSDIKGLSTIRHDKFLIVSPDDCLLEWGNNPKKTPPDKATIFISRLFNRIMTMAYNLIHEIKPQRPPHEIFSKHDLRNDIAAVLPRAHYPSGEAALVVKANYAYTDYTGTLLRGSKGMARVQVRRPRLTHALDMLMTPIPDGEFTFSSGRTLENPEATMLTSPTPMLCEVSVSGVDAGMSSVLAFGNSMDAKKKIMRTWVAHPEAISMSAFAEVRVKSAWQGERYTTLYDTLPKPIIDFLSCNFAPVSWSAGIMAETIWKAACLRNPYRGNPKEPSPDTSWRGLWIKSSDKVFTFTSAMEMSRKNWTVSAYGAGGIWLMCPPDQVSEIVKSAFACGLIPRLDAIPQKFDQTTRWNGDASSKVLANLMLNREFDVLLEVDKLMVLPQANRATAFGVFMKKKQGKSA